MPPYSHRQEKWQLENPEHTAEKFEELDQEFDEYHGLDKEEQASLHHDFDIHKHEHEKTSYDERVHLDVDKASPDFAIKHLGGKHDVQPVKVHEAAVETHQVIEPVKVHEAAV